jgi:hypothetical protein
MSERTPAEPRYQVPGAVHEATRSLLRLRTGGDARRVAEHLIHELGGQLVPAGPDDPGVIPVDVSFGDGEPLLAAAPPGANGFPASRPVLASAGHPGASPGIQVLPGPPGTWILRCSSRAYR